MIARIIVGLLGLGLVVLVHEIGHFIVARLMGIDVESFSVGWGKALWSRKIRGVEYRIGILPIGGYCRMRGEAEFREALSRQKNEIPRDTGTFYGATPMRRIFVAFAGPAANAIFAIIVLSFVWGFGFEVRTLSNRIVLASEIDHDVTYPADKAGLMTGDRIVGINGKPITNYQEIQEDIAPYAGEKLQLKVDRSGARLDVNIIPKLDPETGAGKIGVYFWTDPIVETIKSGSAAAIAGIKPGDLLIAANGMPLRNTVDLSVALRDKPTELKLQVEHTGIVYEKTLIVSWPDKGNADLGIDFETIRFRTPKLSIPKALAKGVQETWKTFTLSVRSITLLFRGVNLTKAVSGPVRITYMVGDVAAEGFDTSIEAGISALASFLALLSVALFIMNLLPIPALDGGLIVLFTFELLRRKALHPKIIYRFQMVGTSLIFSLLLFSLFGDILFLLGR